MLTVINENGEYRTYAKCLKSVSVNIKDYKKTKRRILKILKKEKKTCEFHKSILMQIIEEMKG